MAKKKKNGETEIPLPFKYPEIDNPVEPDEPLIPSEEPDVSPDENPYETPPEEIPPPDESSWH